MRFSKSGKEKLGEAQTIDISANGIGLISKIKLSPNTPLQMWVNMPDEHEPLFIIGRAIWHKSLGGNKRQWRIGVHFKKEHLMDLSRIYYRSNEIAQMSYNRTQAIAYLVNSYVLC